MGDWDVTHGIARGSYLRTPGGELYVRQGGRGFPDTT